MIRKMFLLTLVFFLLIGFLSELNAATVMLSANTPKKAKFNVDSTLPQAEKKKSVEYLIFVTGDLKSVLAKGAQENGSFANASFGVTRLSDDFNFGAMIKVVDNKEPIKSDYSLDIFNIGGKNNLGGKIDATFITRNKFHNIFQGVKIYGEIASTNWAITKPENQSETIPVTLAAVGLGLQRVLFDDTATDSNGIKTSFSSSILIGLTSRLLLGDIGLKINDETRKDILETNKKFFIGGEIYYELKFNDLKGFIDFTYFFTKMKGGNGRVTVGIAIEAPLFRMKFDKGPLPPVIDTVECKKIGTDTMVVIITGSNFGDKKENIEVILFNENDPKLVKPKSVENHIITFEKNSDIDNGNYTCKVLLFTKKDIIESAPYSIELKNP